jgi:predicted dehydrogenase
MGFMGRMHFNCWKQTEDAKITALCDADKEKLKGESGTQGNVSGTEQPLDFSGIELYTDFSKMLADEELDAISIATPTHLHADNTIEALEAGVNVLCEKPMALNTKDCERMIAAGKKSGKILQVGHCLRFWPEYVKAREIIESGEYGKLKVATFRRLSLPPIWTANNWMMDGVKSGGGFFDLHIHDADFVQWVFGMPKAVSSNAITGPSSELDHIVTNYIYDDKLVMAEGGWMMASSFGFEMSFNLIFEKASVIFDCTREPAFKICPDGGEVSTPKLASADGYIGEINHFSKLVSGQKMPKVLTPEQSRDTIRLMTAEKESAQTGAKVTL